jgi:hypothetical protein
MISGFLLLVRRTAPRAASRSCGWGPSAVQEKGGSILCWYAARPPGGTRQCQSEGRPPYKQKTARRTRQPRRKRAMRTCLPFLHRASRVTGQSRRPRAAAWIVFAFLAACCLLPAAEYVVAPNGSDDGPGSREAPWKTLAHAAETMVAGDLCLIRDGIYRESVVLKRSGTAEAPIRFVGWAGERPVICGLDVVKGEWIHHADGVWRTRLPEVTEQVFIDSRPTVEARWPNMSFDQRWDRGTWATCGWGSTFGLIKDPELAETGIDWTGAEATLNVAHQWFTWCRTVQDHDVGRDTFSYSTDGFRKVMSMKYAKSLKYWGNDFYCLFGKLEALDAPGEWHCDRDTTVLYLQTYEGDSPAKHVVEVKARDYGISAAGVRHVVLQNLTFRGCAITANRASDWLVDGCHFEFATVVRKSNQRCSDQRLDGNHITIRNCSVSFSAGHGFSLSGYGNTVDNCVIHDTAWSGSQYYAGIRMRHVVPKGQTFDITMQGVNAMRRNTVYNVGACVLYFSRGTEMGYNHVYDGGLLCEDIAMAYSGGDLRGSVVHHNWVHGCRTPLGHGIGIRGDDQTHDLVVHHNVVWDNGGKGLIIKGNDNRYYCNTVMYNGSVDRPRPDIIVPTQKEPHKPWVKQKPLLGRQNSDSHVMNNAARLIDPGEERLRDVVGEGYKGNVQGQHPEITSLAEWDFVPAADSALVDAGVVIPGYTDGFVGKAPDAGAYERGLEPWLPGHRNGVWLSAPVRSAGGHDVVRCRLALPVRDRFVLRVAGDITLEFTQDNWRELRVFRLSRGTPTVVLDGGAWGKVTADLTKADPHGGLRLWFPRPDVGPKTPPDARFQMKSSMGPTSRAPIRSAARAFRVASPPSVDGVHQPAEWPNWIPERALFLGRLFGPEAHRGCLGEAYVLFDSDALYVAVRLLAPPAESGETWGVHDGVEVDFQVVDNGFYGPKFVLHGFPTGACESVNEAGATAEQATTLGDAVSYAAETNPAGWTCEFRIPLTPAGVDLRTIEKIRLNIGAYQAGRGVDGWHAWIRTQGPEGGANHDLAHAGDLLLRPACPAETPNLLRNGHFNVDDVSPWSDATWRLGGGAPQANLIRPRDKGGAPGDRCMYIDSTEVAEMTKTVAVWQHPLPDDLPAGNYLMTFDVRSQEVQGGAFISCLFQNDGGPQGARFETRDAKVRHEYQGMREYAIKHAWMPWTRRDCLVQLPEGAKARRAAIMRYCLAGHFWIDNVALYRLPPQ